jgi:hypothetical protein
VFLTPSYLSFPFSGGLPDDRIIRLTDQSIRKTKTSPSSNISEKNAGIRKFSLQ